MVIWFIFGAYALETLNLEFGYALGSIFAIGGLGSASIVLATKETFENLIGGFFLRLNDKFRLGETISFSGKIKEQGKVVEMSYLTTSLLHEDNSIISIPNKIFTGGELINWSRTAYRLFKTSVNVPIGNIKSLPDVINSIRQGLEAMPQIERDERDIMVAATGFDARNIQIDVSMHFKATKGVDALKTQAVNIIADCMNAALS